MVVCSAQVAPVHSIKAQRRQNVRLHVMTGSSLGVHAWACSWARMDMHVHACLDESLGPR